MRSRVSTDSQTRFLSTANCFAQLRDGIWESGIARKGICEIWGHFYYSHAPKGPSLEFPNHLRQTESIGRIRNQTFGAIIPIVLKKPCSERITVC